MFIPTWSSATPQTWTNYSTGQALYLYGQVANGGNLLTVNPVAQAVNIYGGIGGAGGLTMTGGNTLNLYGANSFTGPITLAAAGTIDIGGNGSLGLGNYSRNIAIGTGKLQYGSNANQTLGGVLSGSSGQLLQSGNGTLTLTASETYGGATTVSAGVLSIGNGGSGEGLASPTIVDTAAVVFNHSDALTYSGTISGAAAP